MGRSPQTLRKQDRNSDVLEFMAVFARYLVAAGITNTHFASITRFAYFRAAAERAKFRNSRLNYSAIAAMTGLTRSQVREFAQVKGSGSSNRPSRIENIMRGWQEDPLFTTPSCKPRRLSMGGKDASFNRLVQKYGGDIPARSTLQEMLRNKLVTMNEGNVCLNQSGNPTRGQIQLQHLSALLTRLVRQPKATPAYIHSMHSMIREVSYPSSSSKGRLLLHRKSAEGLNAFLRELQAAGIIAAMEAPPRGRQKSWVTRIRVLMLTEERDSPPFGGKESASKEFSQ